MDIAALQETRLAENSLIQELNYTFYLLGKAEHGLEEGGLYQNTLLAMMEPPTAVSVKLLALRLCADIGRVQVLCASPCQAFFLSRLQRPVLCRP